MVTCPNCKKTVYEQDIFCSNCGFSLISTSFLSQAQKLVEKPLKLDLDTITRYEELEKRIEGLLSVPSELRQQKAYLVNLQGNFTNSQNRFRTLEIQKAKEWKDVEKLEKMSVTSLVARVKGTKDIQLEKEKMEYFDALNKEEAAAKEIRDQTALINETEKQVNQLENLVRTKRELEKNLEELIHSLTKGVVDPIEDVVERQLADLNSELEPLQNKRSRMTRAGNHLEHAVNDLQAAHDKLGGASGLSTWDTFFGGGLIVDSIKHSKMSEARDYVQNAHSNIQRAINEWPDIPTLKGAQVEELSFFWDGFMDNIFSDLSSRGKINRSKDSVREALHDSSSALNWLDNQIIDVKNQFSALNQQITIKRKELLKERRRMVSEAIEKQKTV